MKQATATLKRQYVKQWIKLLTQAAEKVDGFFFESDSEDESEVRPFFYAAIAFGIIITLLIVWRTF